MNTDPLIFRTGPVFRSGSGYTLEQEAALGTSLCRFLNESGLVHIPLSLRDVGQWDDFELRLSHLTEQGFLVMRCGLDKWLKGLDRGKDVSDTSVMKKCLAKVTG